MNYIYFTPEEKAQVAGINGAATGCLLTSSLNASMLKRSEEACTIRTAV